MRWTRRRSMEGHIPRRRVSLIERWGLVQQNMANPQVVTYLASYPSNALSIPTLNFLTERINFLQSRWPLLWAEVKDGRTSKPYFQPRREGSWTPEQVLTSRPVPEDIMSAESNFGQQELAMRLIKFEVDRMADGQLYSNQAKNSPWQITIWSPSATDPFQISYLTLSVNHIFCDGMGGLRFFLTLLLPASHPTLSSLHIEELEKIPVMEDTISLRPPLRNLIPLFWSELVIPSFPSFLQAQLKATPAWPGELIHRPLLGSGWSMTTGAVDKSVVDRLKAAGKRQGVLTMHPVLQTVYLVGLWGMFRHEERTDDVRKGCWGGFSGARSTKPPAKSDLEDGTSSVSITNPTRYENFKLTTSTPRSERDLGKGHAYCTGNYLSDWELLFEVTPRSSKKDGTVRSRDGFWARAKWLSEFMVSEKGIKDARGGVGMLSFLPNGVNKNEDESSKTPTEWETVFAEKLETSSPIRLGVAISNLGYVAPDSLSSTDILWGQSSLLLSAAIILNIIGLESGLKWTTGFREGVAVRKDQVEMLDRWVERMLVHLAVNDSVHDLGLEELLAIGKGAVTG